jgi:dephospho-CoA kinase
MDWRKDAIAVTGSPGSGKSTTSKIFEKHGFYLIDADSLARKVLANGSTLAKRVIEEFGNSVANPKIDDSIDRTALAKIVFENPALKKKLEAMVHPEIAKLAVMEAEDAQSMNKAIVYDCPLLFESGIGEFFKATVVVSSPRQLAMKRYMDRTGCSQSDFESRETSQMSLSKKLELGDYVIKNYGSFSELERTVEELIANLPS